MKTIFSSIQECCHVYAQRNQARGNSGNVFFEGNTIYSYGYHFPMASFIETKEGLKCFINSDSYSPSTSKQQSFVRQAVSHYDRIYVSGKILKMLIGPYTPNELCESVIEQTRNAIVECSKLAAARRMATKKANDIANGIAAYEANVKLLALFGLKMPVAITKLKDTMTTDLNSVIKANDKAIKAAKRKLDKARAKAQAEREKEALEASKDWLAGDDGHTVSHALYHSPVTYLRIKGAVIQTSQRAEFPIKHAKLAFKYIVDCIQNKKEFHTNGKTIHLGHYQIDSIDIEGNVKAGCHYVKYDQIERIAKELGLV